LNAARSADGQPGDDELSAFLLALYAVAGRVRVDEFRARVFPLLEVLLKIDSAWWGTGMHKKNRLVIAQASLYRLGPDFIADYAKVADQDPLVGIIDMMDGETIVLNEDDVASSAAMNDFDRKYLLHFSMTCMKKDPLSGVGMFISVFRNAPGPAFSEADRLLMQSVVAHLAQAWSINLRLNLASESSEHIPDACLIDGHGRIIEISPVFVDKLHFEFPDWDGHVLPGRLQRLFAQDQNEIFRGKSVNIWNAKSSGGQIRLQCGPVRASVLTPREEAVALAFAKGSSYKEIAATLNLSPGTVRSYLAQCYAKLDVKNKIELGNALGKK
jgi:DNA-binding CsgD family transcriptional regulator